ncbi:MAG TPA: flavodoxin-dependent (E)-4-hydroxy-3-methylbut-2-enyl-diphosphate synthase [Kiritimatiellia bacterium]|nr:flavodoxin-dependent (E)-4-hydroxy-3-methylbut-2-enyl-diphosphate synthase [Kiritimatiellia bacterium]HPW74926.1 flavodoxin-dependent (E)-4-hydroxy-3-methylbut-2-enyl-diphosphate synthase [Kiritimatiellia bacterium]
MRCPRTATRQVHVGSVAIGGGAPVSVQTMANADPHDAEALLRQVCEAAELGCDLVRLTVPDHAAAETFKQVRARSPLPLVADIHFDHRLALAALAAGADGLRINPGNIGGPERVRAVVAAARPNRIPIRIGVNGGSLEKDLLARYGSATPEALVESALRHVAWLEAEDYREMKISVKASDVPRTLAAYRLLSERTDYPLHLGVTEAGTFLPGTVRSCVALGTLLLEGIGDTIRVSLTDQPAQEVRVGVELLRSVGLRAPGASVTSCPTCGRTRVDVAGLALRIENRLERFYREHPDAPRPHVAVMGCVVNGPGEAKGADIAVAGGDGVFVLFVRGERIRTLPEAEALEAIVRLVTEWPRP